MVAIIPPKLAISGVMGILKGKTITNKAVLGESLLDT
jgi:xanthosine utilization system XapX-like protein